MPSMSTILLVICISIALSSITQAAPIGLDDLFSGFVHNNQLATGPAKEGTIVKRRIYADNPDSRLKQVSLQSLIGNVEDSLFNTALSVGSVAHNQEATVPEVTPQAENENERSITKRETEVKEATSTLTNNQFVTTEATPQSKQIYLQTTQKVPAANGVPARVFIDRVSVQPHEGGLPFIPAFQLYHTKVISATIKEPTSTTNADGSTSADGGTKSTKITVAQTSVQASNSASTVPAIATATSKPSETKTESAAATPSTAASTILDTTKSTATTIQLQNVPNPVAATEPSSTATLSASTETSTPTSTMVASTTTKLPIVQLKEAEEELKEKVAEIEAEPVILSARV